MPHLLLALITACFGILFAQSSMAQCNGQEPPNCSCQAQTQKNMTICIAGTNYNIVLYTCEQDANTIPISNPCTYPYSCAGQTQNKISWVKEICFPGGAPAASVAAIYNAIICATDLCVNDYLGVRSSFPNCDPGTRACNTVLGVYCHTLAFPQCVQRSSTCISVCDADCDQYCYVQRRYCYDGSTCETCDEAICQDPDSGTCQGSCLDKVNCGDLSFTACCP
jgi:hypothetical protein